MNKKLTTDTALPRLMERILLLKSLIYDDRFVDTIVDLAEKTARFDKELDEALLANNLSPTDKEAVPEWHRLMGHVSENVEARTISPEARAIIMGGIQRFVDSFITERGLEDVIVELANGLNDSAKHS